jgi:predicted aldo/keto reductase-like oxidoreductase
MTIFSGMCEQSHIRQNVDIINTEGPLSDEEELILFEAAKIEHELLQFKCTGCNYCMGDCPVGLDIPKMVKWGGEARINWRIGIYDASQAKPNYMSCTNCKTCDMLCPQRIPISTIMDDMRTMTNHMMGQGIK